MMESKVTVIMITWSPTPERFDFLQRSFRSFRECTPGPVKLVVIDNGPEQQTQWLKTQAIDVRVEPGCNTGIGPARNLGLDYCDTPYVAFVDTDLLYFPGWLDAALGILEKYPDRKLIVCPPRSAPTRRPKYYAGRLDEYDLYTRASGQCLVFRKTDFEQIGRWFEGQFEDGMHCDTAVRLGYRYIRAPAWDIVHLGEGKQSFSPKCDLVHGQYILNPERTQAGRTGRANHEKRQRLRAYGQAFGIRVFVETGTLAGDTVAFLQDDFDRLYTIDIDPEVQTRAAARFASVPHVRCLPGDSRAVLPQVLEEIREPSLFWLDAHYFGTKSEGKRVDIPVLQELEAILRHRNDHVVLIDDAKVFLNWRHRTAAFPHWDALAGLVHTLRPDWTVRVEKNVIVARTTKDTKKQGE